METVTVPCPRSHEYAESAPGQVGGSGVGVGEAVGVSEDGDRRVGESVTVVDDGELDADCPEVAVGVTGSVTV